MVHWAKLEFGKDLTCLSVIIQEGDIGSILQSNTYGIGVAKENSEWTILAVNATSGQVYHVNYPNICGVTQESIESNEFQKLPTHRREFIRFLLSPLMH